MNIHPTAFISPDATLEEGVEVGPYSIVGPDVHIGENTVIGPHVVIESHTDIGEGCRISPFASIGGAPQDLKYRGEETRVVIGSHNTIREYVTINRATISDIGVTIIGDHNLLMAYCHVAHNCKLGNHIVMPMRQTRTRPCGLRDHRRPDRRPPVHGSAPTASSAAPRR